MQKTNKEEIGLKELILKSAELLRELYAKKRLILLAGVLLMLVFGLRAFFEKPVYPAELNFMIDEDSGNPLGSLSGVLGTFGISQRGKNSLAKILELARSRKIIENALFTQTTLNGENKLLANHLIAYLDSTGQWIDVPWYKFYASGDEKLSDYRFEHADLSKFEETDNKALKKLHSILIGDPQKNKPGMMDGSYDEETRILKLTVSSHNPDLSIHLSNHIFDELSIFYMEKTTEKQAATYQIVREKTDSIKYQIQLRENQLARKDDTSLGAYSQTTRLGSDRLRKDIALLTMALGESIKNLEIADFALKNTMPYIQTIDRPIKPLPAVKKSLAKNLVLGFMLGVFILSFIILFRKVYFDALK